MRISTLIVCLPLFVACSNEPSPGVPATLTLDALQKDQLARLCDWSADQYGGYGKERNCKGITMYAPESKAECYGGGFKAPCQATVADLQAFVRAQSTCTAEGAAFDALDERIFRCTGFFDAWDAGPDADAGDAGS